MTIKSESVSTPSRKATAVKNLSATVQPSTLFTSSTSSTTFNTTVHSAKSPTSKPVFLRANLADIQKAATVNASSRVASSDSEEGIF